MIDRYQGSKAIFIADRGYESFNTFAHVIHSGQKFLIRMKDTGSNGIPGAYDLPNEEFDTYIKTTLTRRHTKITLNHPKIYTIVPPKEKQGFHVQSGLIFTIIILLFETDERVICLFVIRFFTISQHLSLAIA